MPTDWSWGGITYRVRVDTPEANPTRPWNQGDVFVDVPLAAIPKHKESATPDELARGRICKVLLLGHPCSIHLANGEVTPVQAVVEVRKIDHVLTPPYDSHYFYFPLPKLIADDDYVADFRRIGVTHFQFLEGKRIACLTREAWAALIRRYVFHASRFDLGQATVYEGIGSLWHEFDLWEMWTR